MANLSKTDVTRIGNAVRGFEAQERRGGWRVEGAESRPVMLAKPIEFHADNIPGVYPAVYKCDVYAGRWDGTQIDKPNDTPAPARPKIVSDARLLSNHLLPVGFNAEEGSGPVYDMVYVIKSDNHWEVVGYPDLPGRVGVAYGLQLVEGSPETTGVVYMYEGEVIPGTIVSAPPGGYPPPLPKVKRAIIGSQYPLFPAMPIIVHEFENHWEPVTAENRRPRPAMITNVVSDSSAPFVYEATIKYCNWLQNEPAGPVFANTTVKLPGVYVASSKKLSVNDEVYVCHATNQLWEVLEIESGSVVPDGGNDGDMLAWDAAEEEWKVVDVGTPTGGDILHWDGTNSVWKRSEVGTPVKGDILVWDGSKYEKKKPSDLLRYDTTTHQLQIDVGGTWTMITGGQAVPFP